MSYKILLDGATLFSTDAAAVDPRFAVTVAALTEEENKIPKLEYTIPPGAALYNSGTHMSSTVELYDGTEILFRGRIQKDKQDFWKNKTVSCEGELGFLDDIPDTFTTSASEESPLTVQGAFSALLTGYAAKADAGRKIYAGTCDVTGSITKSGGGQCWDTINGWLKDYGGYLFIWHEDGKTYLDYKAARPATDTSQSIRFGVNMMETLEAMTDTTKLETGVLAIGGKPEGSSTEVTLDGYSAADVENGVLFASSRAYYGTKYKKVTFGECLTQAALYTAAGAYLNGVNAAAVSLKLGAIENKLLGLAPQHMKMSTPYNVISAPHGLNAAFPLTKRKLDILSPESSTTEYGASETALTEKHASWSRTANTAKVTAETALQTASTAMTKAENAVPKTRTVNGHALSSDLVLEQEDLGAVAYVTATGSNNNGWSWRKWSSGKVEMWAENLEVSLGTSSSWTTDLLYQNGSFTYPLTLDNSKPIHVRTQVVKPDGVSEVNGIVLIAIKQSTGAQIRFVRKTAATKVFLDVYVKGNEVTS